ncbi:MAG: RNA polymerase sigma factor [Candidatus Cyclobacteriaceae bacterium M3_2C_046]
MKKDRKAQRVLYDHFKFSLRGVCLRYAGNEAEADDIFQEAFIKVFQNLKKLKDPQALPGWVRQTVIRTAINYYHQQQRNNMKELDTTNEYYSDFSMVLDDLSNQQLLELIKSLPDGYRVVFNLYVIDGYTHREISEMLKISENTSKTQLFKAKSILKRALTRLGIKKYEKDV